MDKITGSPILHQGLLESNRQREQIETDKTRETRLGVVDDDKKAKSLAPASGDTAQISATAHRLMALRQAVEAGRTALAMMPETRAEKVAQARERLENGFYDSDSVREKTAAGVEETLRGLDKL